MTGKSEFTEEEWKAVLEGPPGAGVIVAAASRGGTFRESFAIAKAYVDARTQHGQSELLDEIESARPGRDGDQRRGAGGDGRGNRRPRRLVAIAT
jgi:hypothetical protein